MSVENVGDNVRRRMKMNGLSIAQLSSQIGMGTATLSNILNGKSEPKSSTLIKLADALDVNIPQLLEQIPRLETLRFRTAKTLSAREKAAREQIRLDTAVWLQNYHFLENELHEKRDYAFSSLNEKDPIEAANIIREHYFGDRDNNYPIYDIANLIESAGIRLKIHRFGFKKTSGLSVGSSDEGPAIVVNSETEIPVERQIFTIAHELGHLLLHSDSYRKQNDIENVDEENEANIFAGSFLVPENGLIKEWEDSHGLHWVDAVLKIKKMYKVSYKTVLLRLSQIYPHIDSLSIYRDFAIAYGKLYSHDLKNYYEPEALAKSDLIEDHFASLVKNAYEKDIISFSRAGEMLNLSNMDMRVRAMSWQDNPVDA